MNFGALTNPVMDIFLISSPLQALVVWILLDTELSLKNKEVIVFLEGHYRLPPLPRVKFVYLENTRTISKNMLQHNLNSVLSHVNTSCNLWVSDLLWPMNNATYSALLYSKKLKLVNFFDEGMVLYWLEKMPYFRLLREHIKFDYFKNKYRALFTPPKARPFYDNRLNGNVFALQPDLLTYDEFIKPITINTACIRKFDEALDTGNSLETFLDNIAESPSALLLGQPYYNITSKNKFQSLLENTTNYLHSIQCKNLFVKLHPSEGDQVFAQFYEPLGYRKALQCSQTPIEAKLHAIPEKTILISHNSSALLNAKCFGFRGRVISYGLNWISGQYYFQRRSFSKQHSLFNRSGVEVVPYVSV